jgi:hypothetical protein
MLSMTILCCLTSVAIALPRDLDHADVLPESTFHFGLIDLNYGISDTLEIGSIWGLNLVGIPNGSIKWKVYDGQGLQAAIRTSVFHYDIQTQSENASPFTSTLLPLSVIATSQHRSLTVSGELAFTRVLTTGQYSASTSDESDSLSLSDVQGSLNLSTGVFKTTVLWDYSQGFAWVFDASFSLFQRVEAMGDSTFELEVDERTSARGVIQGSGSGDLRANNAKNFSVFALWYWSSLHVKAGLTTGDLMIPYINLFLINGEGEPISFVLPKLDIFWRF